MLSDTYLTFVNPTTVRKIHRLVTDGEKFALDAEFDHAVGAAGTHTVARQALAFSYFCEAMALLRDICDDIDDALGKAGM